MKGDGLQNGGALIVGPGGKLLLSFRQEGPAEHISNSKILQVIAALFLFIYEMHRCILCFRLLELRFRRACLWTGKLL